VARAVLVSLLLALSLPACNTGQPPAFCGVTDQARLAISNVSPDRYASEAGKHVAEVRRAAEGLSGEQGTLARKVADDLEAASEAPGGSMEFTLSYNRFVKDSNDFDHAYCNEPNEP